MTDISIIGSRWTSGSAKASACMKELTNAVAEEGITKNTMKLAEQSMSLAQRLYNWGTSPEYGNWGRLTDGRKTDEVLHHELTAMLCAADTAPTRTQTIHDRANGMTIDATVTPLQDMAGVPMSRVVYGTLNHDNKLVIHYVIVPSAELIGEGRIVNLKMSSFTPEPPHISPGQSAFTTAALRHYDLIQYKTPAELNRMADTYIIHAFETLHGKASRADVRRMEEIDSACARTLDRPIPLMTVVSRDELMAFFNRIQCPEYVRPEAPRGKNPKYGSISGFLHKICADGYITFAHKALPCLSTLAIVEDRISRCHIFEDTQTNFETHPHLRADLQIRDEIFNDLKPYCHCVSVSDGEIPTLLRFWGDNNELHRKRLPDDVLLFKPSPVPAG